MQLRHVQKRVPRPAAIVPLRVRAALLREVEEPPASTAVDYYIGMAAHDSVRPLRARFAQQILRLLLPSRQIVRTKYAKPGVRVIDQPVGAVPLKDHRPFAMVRRCDALVRPVHQVGGVAEVDLRTVSLVLVPQAPVAIRQPE